MTTALTPVPHASPRPRITPHILRRNLAGWLFASPWIIGFILCTVGPMIASLWIALTEWDLMSPPRWVGLANVTAMFDDALVAQALKVTSVYALVSVPIHLAVGLLLALLLNSQIGGLRFYRTAFYMPSVLSGVAVALLWRWLFSTEFGLFNTMLSYVGIVGPSWLGDERWALPSLIMMSVWSVGAVTIIYLAGLQGIPTPPSDWEDTTWTFESFLETATALTKGTADRTDQWGFLVNRGQRPYSSWLYSNGGGLVHKDDRGVATDSAMTDEASVQALQFIQDLMYTHKVAPRPDIESELGGFELFATGRVGMMVNNPSAVNRYRTIESFKWNVATIPLGAAERRGTGGGGTGWASGASTAIPDIAWEFIKHITTPEAELDEVSVGATTPARLSIVTSEAFLNPDLPPANAAAFAQAQEYVVRDPVHVLWPEIFQRVYTPNMDQLWGGTADAATVAQQIKDEADPLFARTE